MSKIFKKIVSIAIYLALMHITYNIFIPQESFTKKDLVFSKKQENIVKFDEMVAAPQTGKESTGYHTFADSKDREEPAHFSCEECHTGYPHKTNRETRAFFNMHSARISCLACHIDSKDRSKVKFGWFDKSGNYKKDGLIIPTARISPYKVIATHETLLEKGIKDHNDLKEKTGIHISKNPELKCSKCHFKTGKTLFDLNKLGYSKVKIDFLRNLDEASMYSGKANWIYPDFL